MNCAKKAALRTHVMVLEITAAIRPWCRVVSRKERKLLEFFGKETKEKERAEEQTAVQNLHVFWQVQGLSVG